MTWRAVVAVVTLAGLSSMISAPIVARQQVREGVAQRPAMPASGSALVDGTLMSDDSSPRPVRRASMTLTSSESSASRVAVTDDSGRFRFTSLPAGRFSLVATRPGFVRTYYGSRHPGRGPGTDVIVADGQRVSLTMTMAHGAVITGTVIDGFGKPIAEIGVQALAYSTAGGPQGSLSLAGINVTDDRGVYRIFGLPAGRYHVVAFGGIDMGTGTDRHSTSAAEVQWAEQQLASTRMSGAPLAMPPPYGRAVAYVPTYFPGTADPTAASAVELTSAEERTIDFALALTPTTTLSGQTVTPVGQPAKGTRLTVIPRNTGGVPDETLALLNGVLSFVRAGTPDGTFQIGGLPPGEYTILARGAVTPATTPGAPPEPPMWGELHVTASGGDQSGLEIRLQPGATVSGSIAVDSSAGKPPENLAPVRLTLVAPVAAFAVPVNSPSPPQVKADGTFAFTGVAPGAYSVQVLVPPVLGPWTVKSATIGGHDILDSALEVETGHDLSGLVITLTDRVTTFSGTLLDRAGNATSGYALVVFPTNRSLWTRGSRRIKAVSAATNGAYRFPGLPAGEYYLAAVTDFDQAELSDPAFLGELVAASRTFTLADGESKVQDFRISGG